MIRPSPRADAHVHLFPNGFLDDGRDELAWYDQLRTRAGLSDALVVGYEGDPRFAGNNAYLRDLSRRRRWMHPTAFVDVSRPPTADRLRGALESGFAGWTVYLPEGGPTLSDWTTEQIHALRGGILSVNATPAALSRVQAAISDLEDTVVLVSHVGLPGSAARGADPASARQRLAPLVALSAYPQVSVKLSGLYAIDPEFPHAGATAVVDAVLEAYGPQRLAWGSDFSPVSSSVDDQDVMRSPDWIIERVSADEADAILGGTLLRHLALIGRIEGTES